MGAAFFISGPAGSYRLKSLPRVVIRIAVNDLELVEEYFRRDLTEAEKKTLDELLERSPEAADFFRERAEEVTQPRPLPEPKLPPLPSFPPPKRRSISLSKWLWVLPGYALLAAGFWLWSLNHDLHWPWDPREAVPATSPAPPFPDATGTNTDLAQDMGAQPDPQDEENDGVTPERVTPLSPSNPTGLGHSGTRIIVERPIPGQVTVTVLDTTGKEVRMLYSGALQSGQWALEWNGRTDDGIKAPAGAYIAQVSSGTKVQQQRVWLDK